MLNAEPRWTKSRTLKELPSRTIPYIESVDPNLTKERRLRELPQATKSSTDIALVTRRMSWTLT
jgi:hypothetical protein